MKNTFKKEERLKSKRIIDALFTSGKVIAVHPVKLFWMKTELPSKCTVQYGVSVPKRRFKHAVDRNKIKRKMREVIRLKKQELTAASGMKEQQIALMVMYTGNEIPAYDKLAQKISEAFDRLNEVI